MVRSLVQQYMFIRVVTDLTWITFKSDYRIELSVSQQMIDQRIMNYRVKTYHYKTKQHHLLALGQA